MKVVITGGAGFIGSHLVDALVARGDRVIVFDDCRAHARRTSAWVNAGADYHRADPRLAADAWTTTAGDCDALVHLAARTGAGPSLQEMTEFTSVNAGLTAWIAESIVRRSIEPGRVVFTSSHAVYGEGAGYCSSHGRCRLEPRTLADLGAQDWRARCASCGRPADSLPVRETDTPRPLSTYGASKLYAEQVLGLAASVASVPTTLLRVFNVFGSRQMPEGVVGAFVDAVTHGAPVHLIEDGFMVRDFVHVQDVTAALIAALDHERLPLGPINIGSGRGTKIEELVREVAHVAGHGAPDMTATQRSRTGDPRAVVANIDRAKSLLRWTPAISLTEGLREAIEWSRSIGAARGVRQVGTPPREAHLPLTAGAH